jgi:hypothetical protein
MSKIIAAEDILNEARNCVECIFMAAAYLSRDEYCQDAPRRAAPGATPKSPVARTKRKRK